MERTQAGRAWGDTDARARATQLSRSRASEVGQPTRPPAGAVGAQSRAAGTHALCWQRCNAACVGKRARHARAVRACELLSSRRVVAKERSGAGTYALSVLGAEELGHADGDDGGHQRNQDGLRARTQRAGRYTGTASASQQHRLMHTSWGCRQRQAGTQGWRRVSLLTGVTRERHVGIEGKREMRSGCSRARVWPAFGTWRLGRAAARTCDMSAPKSLKLGTDGLGSPCGTLPSTCRQTRRAYTDAVSGHGSAPLQSVECHSSSGTRE